MYSIQSAPWLISMGRFKKKSFSKRRLKLKAHKHFYYMNYAISSPVTQDFFYFSYAAFSEKFKPIALNNGAIIKLFINNFLSHLINYFYIFENVFDFSALSTIVFPTFYYSYFGGYKKLNFKIRGWRSFSFLKFPRFLNKMGYRVYKILKLKRLRALNAFKFIARHFQDFFLSLSGLIYFISKFYLKFKKNKTKFIKRYRSLSRVHLVKKTIFSSY